MRSRLGIWFTPQNGLVHLVSSMDGGLFRFGFGRSKGLANIHKLFVYLEFFHFNVLPCLITSMVVNNNQGLVGVRIRIFFEMSLSLTNQLLAMVADHNVGFNLWSYWGSNNWIADNVWDVLAGR